MVSVWKELSLPSRVVVGMSALFALLSVGSLADAVFEFKGFILTGIAAYNYVVDPIRQVLRTEYFAFDVDMFVLISTTYAALRISVKRRRVIPGRMGLDPPAFFALFWYLMIVGILNLIILLTLRMTMPEFPTNIVQLGFILATPIVFFLSARWAFFTERVRGVLGMSAQYLFVIYIVFFVLAAVSEGLTRVT